MIQKFQFSLKISVTVFFLRNVREFDYRLDTRAARWILHVYKRTLFRWKILSCHGVAAHGWISWAIKWKQTRQWCTSNKTAPARRVMYELPRVTMCIFSLHTSKRTPASSAKTDRPNRRQRYAPLFPQGETSLTPSETVIRGVSVCCLKMHGVWLKSVFRSEKPRREAASDDTTIGVDNLNN